MHIDSGIDTGEIIHQIRGNIYHGDNIHQIGNRLIKDSMFECVKLIQSFEKLEKIAPFKVNINNTKVYKEKDFTEESLHTAYSNLSNGIISKYLENKINIDCLCPIIKNKII
jgi:methionyl-tRNA formyltransferase